ncbi:MAG: uroporphyrinogen-III C-methyltransferase [Glaciecola sp.]
MNVFITGQARNTNKTNQQQVIIVGAGPGDAELMTIKGYKALQNADVVLYDWLVSEEVLDLIPAGTEKVFVGKRCAQHSMAQKTICELMVSHAQLGKRVVRLKGGDPAIFARTLEETKILAQHNIPFCIIPGITAASGASAYTGISLTHRDCAQSVRYVTASLKCIDDEPNWSQIVNNCETETLVFYMGLSKLNLITQRLISAGVPVDFPVAVIDKACTSQQQLACGQLNNIAHNTSVQTFNGPALIVVGRVVDHYEAITMDPRTLHQISETHAVAS